MLLPGHGGVVRDGEARLRALLAHRLAREAEVLAALDHEPGTAAGLAEVLYAGVPKAVRGAAARNVLAHLVDLERRGLVLAESGVSEGAMFHRV